MADHGHLSTEEQGDGHRSVLATPSSSKTCTTADTAVYALRTPGTYLFLVQIGNGVITQRKSFKAYILHAKTPDILRELCKSLKEAGEGDNSLSGYCSNILTYFPKITSGKNIQLRVDPVQTPRQMASSIARESTIQGNGIFCQSEIEEPNNLLQRSTPEEWHNISRTITIPSFDFTICLTNPHLCELQFKMSVTELDEDQKPTRDGEVIEIYFVTKFNFDNDYGDKRQKEIPGTGKEKLQQHRETIVTKLKSGLGNVITYLVNAEVLLPSDIEDLQREPANEQARVNELLNILLNREGSLAFFINALEETNLPTNIEIANILRA